MPPPQDPQDSDWLTHFANDKPVVKLAALGIDRLPRILMAAGSLVWKVALCAGALKAGVYVVYKAAAPFI
ncbi:hypothetical protein WG922_13570 [Ramlibacter sp. AN1015]|uniref:hypothetical protein n=1 Tax=Ramlibacter sp. AN1015 TaxID=3133428 RepID=UPI0030C0DB1B